MAIEFQAAQPLSADISRGYGAAEQFTHTLPTFQRGNEAIAHLYMQSAQMRAQAAQHAAALQAQTFNQENQLQAQAQQGELQRQHEAEMQQQRMGGQFGLQEQHANLQAQLSQTQLTQSENMRLQRMRNAVGDVMANSSLSEDEKRDAVMQLQTGIDPLQRRAAQAHVLQMQTQQRALETQIAQADRLEQQRIQFSQDGFRPHVRVDEMDGTQREVILKPDGTLDVQGTALWHEMQHLGFGRNRGVRPGTTGGGTGRTTGGESGGGAEPRVNIPSIRDSVRSRLVGTATQPGPWYETWNTRPIQFANALEEETNREVIGIQRNHDLAHGSNQPTGPQFDQQGTFQQALAEVRRVAPEVPHATQLRMASDRMEELRRQHGRTPAPQDSRLGEQQILTDAEGNRFLAPAGQRSPGQQPAQPIPATVDRETGTVTWTPEQRQEWTPEQRNVMTGLETYQRGLTEATHLSSEQRTEARRLINRATELAVESGGPQRMDQATGARYEALRNQISRMLRPPTQRPASEPRQMNWLSGRDWSDVLQQGRANFNMGLRRTLGNTQARIGPGQWYNAPWHEDYGQE